MPRRWPPPPQPVGGGRHPRLRRRRRHRTARQPHRPTPPARQPRAVRGARSLQRFDRHEGRAPLARRRQHRLACRILRARRPTRHHARHPRTRRRPCRPLGPSHAQSRRSRSNPHRSAIRATIRAPCAEYVTAIDRKKPVMSNQETESVTNPPIATISSLSAHAGETITLRGWLYNMRSSGKLLFPTFRDGTGTIEGIVPSAAMPPEFFDRVKSLTQESSVISNGRVRADARAPPGFELDVDDLQIVHLVRETTPFPISPKEHGVDFLMEHRHLWIRTPRQSAILRIRATIMRAAQEYFDSNGFIRTDPPILTPAACEGTSTLFELDYFGDPAFLTQSGQLYVEATALALGKVYSFGPTFRAEKSKTRRHLTEFWMIEPEVAFMDLEGNMNLAEAFLPHIN